MTENGDRTWVRREVGPDGGVNVHPIDDRLYDGRVGIGYSLLRFVDDSLPNVLLWE